MDSIQLANIEKEALERLQKRHKVKALQPVLELVDEVPSTGKQIFRLGAVNDNDPGGPRYEIVVDENGEEMDLKALSKREARVFFGGERRLWWYRYSYSVKFVYGTQETADGCCCLPGVRSGIYATEINIHNYHDYEGAWLQKSVLPVILAGVPLGREPRSVDRRGWDRMILRANTATMDDGCRISELLFNSAPPAGQPLNVGFLEIVSSVELKVTAVYTATDRDSHSVSIDVEDIPYRIKYPYYWTPIPWQVESASPANPT